LNELSQKISMGLESKEGALRALGEEFPEEKLQEIRRELIEDAQAEGSLNLIKAEVTKQLMDITGMMVGPDGSATPLDPVMLGDGDVLGDGALGPQEPGSMGASQEGAQNLELEQNIRETLVNQAYGASTSPRRQVDRD
jgi:hypothetical protein